MQEKPSIAEAPDTGFPRHEVSGTGTAEAFSDAEIKPQLSEAAQVKSELPSNIHHEKFEMEGSLVDSVELPGSPAEGRDTTAPEKKKQS